MNFIATRSVLLEALRITGKCIGKNIIPILDCYLFNIDGDSLEITGSNMQMFLTTKIEINGGDFKKSIAIPASLLVNYIGTLPECPISFTINEVNDKAELRYSVNIKAASGYCTIPAEDGNNFPKLINTPEVSFEVKSIDLLAGINKTLYACTIDGREPYGGLQICFDENMLTCSGTNGNTVSTFSIPIEIESHSCFIVPVKLMVVLQSLPCDELLRIAIDTKNIVIQVNEDTILRGILVDFNYPDCSRVIPINNPNEISINRQDILTSLKRVNQFANKINSLVVLTMTATELQITGEDTDFAQAAVEKIPHQYAGTDLTIGVNGDFLTSALSKLTGDEVFIYSSTPQRPMILKEQHEEVQTKSNLILVSPLSLK